MGDLLKMKSKKDPYKRFEPKNPVSSVFFLENTCKKLKINLKSPYAGLILDWETIVGKTLAAHTKVASLDKGILLLKCDHSSWAATFRFQEKDFIKMINRIYPELRIRKISLKIAESD